MQRGLECSLSHAQSHCGNADAASIENLQCIDETVTGLAEKIFFRNPAVFEDYSRRVAGTQTELVLLLAGREARWGSSPSSSSCATSPCDLRWPPPWAPRVVRIALDVAAASPSSGLPFRAGRSTADRRDRTRWSVVADRRRRAQRGQRHDRRLPGFDTLVEITVFGTAALGVANLVGPAGDARGARRRRPASAPQSMVFEQVTG